MNKDFLILALIVLSAAVVYLVVKNREQTATSNSLDNAIKIIAEDQKQRPGQTTV